VSNCATAKAQKNTLFFVAILKPQFALVGQWVAVIPGAILRLSLEVVLVAKSTGHLKRSPS
jgi:hypothetical protein